MVINIIGPYPPPYGGISIHVKRLIEKIKIEKITVENMNISSKKIISIFFDIKKNEIYHFNISGWKVKFLLGILSKLNKRIILTIHGVSLESEYNKGNKIIKYLIKWSIKQLSYIICVNENIKKKCLELGVDEKKIKVISPYLNPIIKEEDYKKIDEKVWQFIKSKKRDNYKILTANGNIRFHNNQDLYGLDLLIDVVKELKTKKYKVCLLFALLGYEEQNLKERKYFNELLKKIKDENIANEILIYKVKDTEYYPIIEKIDIFIRSTNTDGDAISLKEAIHLKKPSIASDVVLRPKETLLFESRNLKNLIEVTENLIKNYDIEKEKLATSKVEECFDEILEIYKKLYKER